ncbi:leukemia inhibitory factor receptor-like [Mercenaria mercenaria]|uniref:leukemia inhibitory factor receptor-like n=1 Tax=Mercenaria mercenaria TaxID=6596 RepID=UPI00234E9527|nr:leukemia inhibitory factor receptor-like [Mercenaria mercenaria]
MLLVEPGPVTELKGKPLQNRCVELQWKPSSPTRSYVFIVTYRSTCSPELEKRVYYYKKKFNDSVVICDLVPYTLYTFSVKGRVIEDSGTYIERGYWSKPEVVKVRTDKDVLDVNPVTTPGLYEISADSLSLYWTPMKDCDLHDASDNVSYILSLNNVTKSVKHPAFMAEIDIHVPRMSMLNVTVQASNSVGSPPSNRDVTIFPALDDLSPSELIVQYNKTIKDCVTSAEIVVREKLSKFSDVSHTLVWCKGTQDCQEPVIFEKLKNATAFVFPGNLCDADYRYGLATHGYLKGQSEITDTGIHWELCIYQSGKEIDKPLGNVRLWEVEEGTGFTVEWTHYNCKEMKVFITHYNVEYCVSGDKDDCSCKSKNTVNVSRHNTSYTSTNDLLAGSHVCVWVRGVCSTGKGPANEKPKTLNIGEADSIVLKVIAVVLSLLSFVILMIGLLLFIRKYYRKMKDRGKITLPEIDSNHDNMQGQYDRLLYNETSGMDTSESVPNNYSSAGTTSTRVPNISEGQPLLYYDCESSGDIDGYKQPNDFEAIESGYQEEALTSENSLEVGSEDQEEESQKTLEEQKTAESLANVDMVDRSDVAMKDEPDQNRNIVKSQSELQLDQVNDCNHKENIELQTMTSNCANHFSSASILVPQELEDETELTSIPFEMFIDQEVTSEDLYKEFGSGSTFFYESGVEESNENDKENGKADQLFVKESDSSGGRSYPQDRSESVDGSIDVSDRSDNESGSVNLSGQTSAIACNLTAASEPLEQNSSEKSINGSMSDLSEKDEAETTSDIDGTDNNLNESYSSSVIYKRSEDVRGMSESEDDTGYKRSEDVFSMSESEDDIEGVSGDSADQTKSTDVLKSCDQHVMNMEKLENKNNIVNGLIGKNGFISSVPNLIDNRNSISSGSDSSIEHQSTSSCHGNSGSSSGVKSYVTADVKHNLQEVDRKYNSDGLKPGEKSKKSPYRNGKKIPDVAMS